MNVQANRVPTAASSPAPQGRRIGLVYLLYFLTAVAAEFLVKGLVVSGDAAATASNILAHQTLFRLGWAVGLIGTGCYLVLTVLFYELFRPVDRTLSLLAAFFSLVACATQAAGSVLRLAPLVLLGGGPYLNVFNLGQLQALALLSLKLQGQVAGVELVFFGVYDVLLGYLISSSLFLPRAVGVLMAVAGLGWLTFLAPPFAVHLSPYIQILGFLAELTLMLWLLIRGVDAGRWQEQAEASPGS